MPIRLRSLGRGSQSSWPKPAGGALAKRVVLRGGCGEGQMRADEKRVGSDTEASVSLFHPESGATSQTLSCLKQWHPKHWS